MIIEYSTRSARTVVTEPGVEYPVDTVRSSAADAHRANHHVNGAD